VTSFVPNSVINVKHFREIVRFRDGHRAVLAMGNRSHACYCSEEKAAQVSLIFVLDHESNCLQVVYLEK